MKRITSTANAAVRQLVKLKDRRGRKQQGRFLIEGQREVARAVAAGVGLEALYYCPEFLSEGPDDALLALAPSTELAAPVYKQLSYRENPDGLLAVAHTPQRELATCRLPENALILVLVGTEKPGNLGALLRTADGTGVDAVVVCGFGTDLENPNVIRASMGSLFSVPIFTAAEAEAIAWLQKNEVAAFAATPHTPKLYWDADFRQASAIILGPEHEGLAEVWLRAATAQVKIPMRGLADSLNVATAGALLLYEALRQRR